MAAPGGVGAATTTTYNDDSILQALRRLQPDDLIKHMLETEEWSERLTKECGAELSRAATLNLFVPAEEGQRHMKTEIDEAAGSVAAMAAAAAKHSQLHQSQQQVGQAPTLIEQTMQALAQQPAGLASQTQKTAGTAAQTGVSPGNPPSYPY